MIEYKDLKAYLTEEYPEHEDVEGLLLDVLNGVADVDELKADIDEFKEHNG